MVLSTLNSSTGCPQHLPNGAELSVWLFPHLSRSSSQRGSFQKRPLTSLWNSEPLLVTNQWSGLHLPFKNASQTSEEDKMRCERESEAQATFQNITINAVSKQSILSPATSPDSKQGKQRCIHFIKQQRLRRRKGVSLARVARKRKKLDFSSINIYFFLI